MHFSVITTAMVLALWAAWAVVDRTKPFPVADLCLIACIQGSAAVLGMFVGEFPPGIAACGGFAAWAAYMAWKRRKPRQRRPSKVAGMVRDLGHRLVVTSS